MISPQLAILSTQIITPGEVRRGAVLIRDGKFLDVLDPNQVSKDWPILDVGNLVVMPGIVDTHAHVNEPGRTEWEGFVTATRAAAAGGITTLVDMPLNSIPATTTLRALEIKIRQAENKCLVDYGFWGGLVPGNLQELGPMIENGALGFKSFLIDSGVDEFRKVTTIDLREGMPFLARAGVPLLVHAEIESEIEAKESSSPRSYSTYLNSRPKSWENFAIAQMIDLSRKTGCKVHIVHLSSAESLEQIRKAKEEGVPISVETCPHYLTLSAEEISDGATHFKCAPPIREKSNQNSLWDGIQNGTIDMIVSDHSPCSPSLKHRETGDFNQAWGGISSLQFTLPIIWSEILKRKTIGMVQLTQLMCENPAKLAGISKRKGKIQPGMDADLVIWNPKASFRVENSMIRHRHSLTPYEGKELSGVIEMTYLRGQQIYNRTSDQSTQAKEVPLGQMIKRENRNHDATLSLRTTTK